MPEDPVAKVASGLRKETRIIALYFVAATMAYFAVYYWYSTVDPSFSVWWAIGYLAMAVAVTVAVVWYMATRNNPRVVGFVKSLSSRVREGDYVPWGMRKRGLLLVLDNGLLLTVSQNLVSFRALFGPEGSVAPPTLEEWPALLRTFRGGKRRAYVSSRKGDTWQKSELERVRGLLGSRSAVLVLGEQSARRAANPAAREWTALGIFFIRKWWQRGDAVRTAVDDIERLLTQLKASPNP